MLVLVVVVVVVGAVVAVAVAVVVWFGCYGGRRWPDPVSVVSVSFVVVVLLFDVSFSSF